jgi:DNA-binding IclR family transcriptional regulator
METARRARQGHQSTVNRSVQRALKILQFMAQRERAMTLTELARELEIPKSSAVSLLNALVAEEFAVLDEHAGYSLGVRSFEVGAGYLRAVTPVRAAESELKLLTQGLGATAHFAVLDRDDVVYLAKHDPPGMGLKLASSLGARLPAATTAVGKAQLAYRPGNPGALSPIPPEVADAIRRQGYALDEGETAVGIRCVASPVFSRDGCCGAIGVSCLVQGGPDIAALARAVGLAAEAVTTRLGGKAPAVGNSLEAP